MPLSSDNLVCLIFGLSVDVDGDPVTYLYDWYRNGVLQPGLTTNTVLSSETAEGETWKCVVTPHDGITAGLPGEDSVTVVTPPEIQTISLDSGWNLFSIYLDVGNTDTLSVLASIAGCYTAVWAYDAATTWRRYIPGGAPELNDLNSVEAGKGYWIYMPNATTLTIIGWPIDNITVQLYRGWNLVGYTFPTTQSIADALLSVAGIYIHVSTYAGGWQQHIVDTPDFLNSFDTLESGHGYYIHVNEDCTWHLPP